MSKTIIKYTIYSVIQRDERKKKSIGAKNNKEDGDLQENVAL